MSKPNYRVIVRFDAERKVFLGRVPELEHCTAEGATRGEALKNLEEEIEAQLANMLSHGTVPPKSVDEDEYNGELKARVSKTVHRELAYQARTEGVDLDHLVGEMLASALEARKANRGQQGRRPGGESHNQGNQRGGYGRGPGVNLDDRANFIEYVRGLEGGGNSYNRGGHQQGGHGGGGHNNDRRRRRGRGGHGHPGGHNQQRNFSGPQQSQGAPQNTAAPAAPAAAPPPPPSDGGDNEGNV